MTKRTFLKSLFVGAMGLLLPYSSYPKNQSSNKENGRTPPLMGWQLNEEWDVDKEIFTHDELKNAGFVPVSYPAFVVDANGKELQSPHEGSYPMVIRMMKINSRYSHKLSGQQKLEAKTQILDKLRAIGIVYVFSIALTRFSDNMDYSNCSYDLGVVVRGCRSVRSSYIL